LHSWRDKPKSLANRQAREVREVFKGFLGALGGLRGSMPDFEKTMCFDHLELVILKAGQFHPLSNSKSAALSAKVRLAFSPPWV
jgi:hypothetical protein